MEHPSLRYDFDYFGEQNNSYIFSTNSQVIYEVGFKPTSYLFSENPLFTYNTYELGIKVIETAGDNSTKLDPYIPPTIAAIFLHFFQQKENIVVYTCETADLKHHARNRKFNQWFMQFNDGNFIKIDCPINDPVLNLI